MLKLLVHAATFRRLEPDLKGFSDRVSSLVMENDGKLMTPGAPDIAYGTQDAYFSPAAPSFFQTMITSPRLRWFQSSAAGLEHPMIQAVGAKAELFTRSHEQSSAIAEWVLWAAFDWLQDGPARRAAQARREWRRQAFREISGTRWLIVGFGHIGREIARRVGALGGHITGVRRTPGSDADADDMIQPDVVERHLSAADIVVLCCPLTPETEGLANARFFQAMGQESLFVNVGRGALVDEVALIDGLARHQPCAAALDVTAIEPLPADSPIWAHPQITLTPHISALTDGAMRRTDGVFLRNLKAFLEGGEMENLVAKSAFGSA